MFLNCWFSPIFRQRITAVVMMSTSFYDRCLHFLFSPPTIYQSPSTHWKRTSLPADHIPVTFNTLKENFSPRRPYTSRLQHTERELLSPPTIYQSPSTHWKRKPPLSSCRALRITSKALGLTALFGPLLHGVCLGRVFVPTLSSWSGLKTIRPYENPALNKCGLSWFGLSWYGLG
jgi:hypothetical protein